MSFALDNIAVLSDTDVFPRPVENYAFRDCKERTIEILSDIDANFEERLAADPPLVESLLTAVGYTGFRRASQIAPIWNAYFLALVLSVAEDIEGARISIRKSCVFSYRYHPDRGKGTIFSYDIGWTAFQRETLNRIDKTPFILKCDISDFYPRIYHHRLHNALSGASSNSEAVRRIGLLLSRFSDGVSYGLPVGGPAARLLSELVLNRVDRLLHSHGVSFCRFADDYHIFAESREQAYGHLIFLSDKLLVNEGLLLQKSKTEIMSRDDFRGMSEFVEDIEGSEEETEMRSLLSLRLRYDPYSSTADADYEELRRELAKHDILGMLGRELRKSRVHQALIKRLVGAIRYLDDEVRDNAVVSLAENLRLLYPVFSVVMIAIKRLLPEMGEEARRIAFYRLRELFRENSYVVQVPVNAAYGLRVLGRDPAEEAEAILAGLYQRAESMLLKKDIVLAMAKRGADYWVSDRLKRFSTTTDFEKVALIVASYILGDEGKHWRSNARKSFTPVQQLLKEWAAEKVAPPTGEIPL